MKILIITLVILNCCHWCRAQEIGDTLKAYAILMDGQPVKENIIVKPNGKLKRRGYKISRLKNKKVSGKDRPEVRTRITKAQYRTLKKAYRMLEEKQQKNRGINRGAITTRREIYNRILDSEIKNQ